MCYKRVTIGQDNRPPANISLDSKVSMMIYSLLKVGKTINPSCFDAFRYGFLAGDKFSVVFALKREVMKLRKVFCVELIFLH